MTALLTALRLVTEYWKPVAIALLLVSTYGAGYYRATQSCDARREREIVEALLEQKAVYERNLAKMQKSGEALEKQLAKQRNVVRILDQRLKYEITKHPVYTQCKPTPDGVRLINEAIRAGKN